VRVRVFDTSTTLARAAARDVARALAANPRIVLGLPTGSTPIPLYAELVRLHELGRANFRSATTFNLDEFLGIAPSDPGSFRTFMNGHLFNRVNLAAERIHFLNGVAADPEAECARYERAIAAAGGIDLLLLGLGSNGHIGFNEPAPELQARTHRVTLTPETRASSASLFGGDADAVPAEALSMGMATILQARAIVLLATGASKASIVERVVRGPITPQRPASFLQTHRDVELVLDAAAATAIT
jgi:glucosamine-6-phosphate deaminase